MTEREFLFIQESLSKPATRALLDLEHFKTRPDILAEARNLETAGKCRWQIMNQLRLWAADQGAAL